MLSGALRVRACAPPQPRHRCPQPAGMVLLLLRWVCGHRDLKSVTCSHSECLCPLLQTAAVFARSKARREMHAHRAKWLSAVPQLHPFLVSLGSQSSCSIPSDGQGRAWRQERCTVPVLCQDGAKGQILHSSPRPYMPVPKDSGAWELMAHPPCFPPSQKLLPDPIPIPSLPSPRSTLGPSPVLAPTEPFTSLLSPQGRFLHRPEMREGVGRTRVCGQNHQHQEAVCPR